MAEESNTEVFVYTEGAVVPEDVVRVRVHPSITIIPEEAFYKRQKLKEVELCEGVIEIGKKAFLDCWELKRITIPSTITIIHESAFDRCIKLLGIELFEGSLEKIGKAAFNNCISLKSIHLPDSIEIIEGVAFTGCQIANFRTPLQVTTLPTCMFLKCESLFSVELSEDVTRIKGATFRSCHLLRNIALPSDTDIEDGAFHSCTDLQQLFGRQDRDIMNALKHRFDKLPIHKMIYYQSYNNVTVDQLTNALDMRSCRRRMLWSKSDQTGNKKDCLGMTPLHILACSTVQNLELYKVLVTKYPENLIAKDRWGAIPLLYAVLRNAPTREAPSKIVQFLVESYKSLYPNHQFDWNEMVLSFARFDTLVVIQPGHDVLRHFCELQKESFPDQKFDWDVILEDAVSRWDGGHPKYISTRCFRHLVRLSTSTRMNGLGYPKVIHYAQEMLNKVHTTDLPEGSQGRRNFIAEVQEHLVHCEEEYRILKEATTLLELTLWKKSINEHYQEANETEQIKKVEMEESTSRTQCHVGCGADIVIGNVLPYLVIMKE